MATISAEPQLLSAVRQFIGQPRKMLIDGQWVAAASGKTFEAYNPATNSWITLPPMPMPRHGVAGAVIGNRFHLVSGMIQSAGALTFLDPTLSTHTAMHDILELQFGIPSTTASAR